MGLFVNVTPGSLDISGQLKLPVDFGGVNEVVVFRPLLEGTLVPLWFVLSPYLTDVVVLF